MTDAPEKRTLGRRIFDGLAVATLVGFVAFCTVITLCAARIPALKERAQRKSLEGWNLLSVEYLGVRFGANDDQVWYTKDQVLEKDGLQRRQSDLRSWPTGRTSAAAAPHDARATRAVLRELLVKYQLLVGLEETEIVVSHDHREIALTSGPVVHRSATGAWKSVTGERLPAGIERVAERPRRIDSADPQEWADAAIGVILRDGARASVFADRLILVHRRPGFETDALIGLLLERKYPDGDAEIVRVILDVQDGGLQRRLIDGAENPERRYVLDTRRPLRDPAARKSLVTAAAERDWGDRPTDVVRGWALEALEDDRDTRVNVYVTLDGAVRRKLVQVLRRHVRPSYAARLARAVDASAPIAAVAAYVLLRHAVGEPIEAEPAPEMLDDARAWVVELRVRKPELFKEQ